MPCLRHVKTRRCFRLKFAFDHFVGDKSCYVPFQPFMLFVQKKSLFHYVFIPRNPIFVKKRKKRKSAFFVVPFVFATVINPIQTVWRKIAEARHYLCVGRHQLWLHYEILKSLREFFILLSSLRRASLFSPSVNLIERIFKKNFLCWTERKKRKLNKIEIKIDTRHSFFCFFPGPRNFSLCRPVYFFSF